MEVVCIIDVRYLSWVNLMLKRPEIIFAEFCGVLGCENFSRWVLSASLVLVINCLPGSFGKTFTVEIFTCYLRNVACISWDMLCLHIGIGASNPVWANIGVVAILKSLSLEVLNWWIDLIVVLLVVWFRNWNIDIVFWVWNTWFGDDFIDTASSAAEDFVFLGNVTGVAGEVGFAIVDECFRRHF